jgi:hypothetical protein
MTKPIARDPFYRRRVFGAEIIELCAISVRQVLSAQCFAQNECPARGLVPNSCILSKEDSPLQCQRHRMRAIVCAELCEDALDVGFDGVL